jgi:hypothetical protein
MWGKNLIPAILHSLVGWNREYLLNYAAETRIGKAISERTELFKAAQKSKKGLESIVSKLREELESYADAISEQISQNESMREDYEKHLADLQLKLESEEKEHSVEIDRLEARLSRLQKDHAELNETAASWNEIIQRQRQTLARYRRNLVPIIADAVYSDAIHKRTKVLYLDEEDIVIKATPRAVNFLGLKEENLVGMNFEYMLRTSERNWIEDKRAVIMHDPQTGGEVGFSYEKKKVGIDRESYGSIIVLSSMKPGYIREKLAEMEKTRAISVVTQAMDIAQGLHNALKQ